MKTDLCLATDKISKLYHERNDCTVKALSIAAGMPYREAHHRLKVIGRVHGRGVRLSQYKELLQALPNYSITILDNTDCFKQSNGCSYTAMSINKLFPKGNYILFSYGHVFAMVDGVVHNYTNGRKFAITEAYKITETW